jgi:hypothetical protein
MCLGKTLRAAEHFMYSKDAKVANLGTHPFGNLGAQIGNLGARFGNLENVPFMKSARS